MRVRIYGCGCGCGMALGTQVRGGERVRVLWRVGVGKSVLMLGLMRMLVLMRVLVCQATPQHLRGELDLLSSLATMGLPWPLPTLTPMSMLPGAPGGAPIAMSSPTICSSVTNPSLTHKKHVQVHTNV